MFLLSTIIIVLLIGVIIALLFSFQNQTIITIYFLSWTFEERVSTILFLTFAFGVILAFISLLPIIIKAKREIHKLNRKLKDLEKELISLNNQKEENLKEK